MQMIELKLSTLQHRTTVIILLQSLFLLMRTINENELMVLKECRHFN